MAKKLLLPKKLLHLIPEPDLNTLPFGRGNFRKFGKSEHALKMKAKLQTRLSKIELLCRSA